MRESFLKYREHLATLVLFVVALNIVVAVVRVALRAPQLGLATSMLAVGDFMGLVSVLALGVTVGACVLGRPQTKHAHLIATLAAVLVTVGTVMAAVFFVIGMFSRQAALAGLLEAVGGLTDILLKAGAAFALWTLAKRAPRPVASGTLDQLPAAEPAPAAVAPPATAPTVARDAAAGARWNSAAEAAQGAKAQWGSDEAGWNPGRPAVAEPAAELEAAQPTVVTPRTNAALEGPAAKASKDLWRA